MADRKVRPIFGPGMDDGDSPGAVWAYLTFKCSR
jgi:hypothetical protein